MKTVIEDDVLFTDKTFEEHRFERQANSIWVYDSTTNESKVGELLVHHDWEMQEAYEDSEEEFTFDDVHYVYINNELVYLNRLNIVREWQ